MTMKLPPPEHDWQNIAETPIKNEVVDWCWRCGSLRHGPPIGDVFYYNTVGRVIGDNLTGEPLCVGSRNG